MSLLAPRPGELLLDVGTGTGGIALRAARLGAEVAAVDISPEMLDQARANASQESLEIRFDEGDAQRLPYDASFDIVASSFGAVFAPDREAVARELARVTRSGGRLGLTAWRPRPEAKEIYARFDDEPPGAEHTDWGAKGFVESLLGERFDLDVRERVWHLEADSAADAYEFLARSAPPTRAFVERLDPELRPAFRAAMVEHFERYADESGRVREPRAYIVVLGKRQK